MQLLAPHCCCCAGGFYIGRLSGGADFPGSILISLAGYFFGCERGKGSSRAPVHVCMSVRVPLHVRTR